MNTLLPVLLDWLQQYGYPLLWLCVFIAAAGIPLPLKPILLAMGAFAAFGTFNLFLLAVTTISAAICGDSLGYWIGRYIGIHLMHWLQRQQRVYFVSPRILARAQLQFQRHGGWAVFLSRGIIPAIGGVINFLAGIERYPYRRFLLYEVSGQITGISAFLLLGYVFGASWQRIGDLIASYTQWIFALLIVVYLTVLVVRRFAAYPKRQSQHAQPEASSRVEQNKEEPLTTGMQTQKTE